MGNMKFKVGDRVRIKSLDWYNENKNKRGFICFDHANFIPEMSRYCGEILTINRVVEEFEQYLVSECAFAWTDEMIEGLVEEEVFIKANDIYNEEYSKGEYCHEQSFKWGFQEGYSYSHENDKLEISLKEGYQFVDENGNVINATKIVLEKKKKEYPKTYEECCEILQYNKYLTVYPPFDADVPNYDALHLFDLLEALRKLLICRDAYWKIVGEEMGLGKPWEPDWLDDDTRKYVITSSKVFETFGGLGYVNYALSFPSAEMRDAFYENFKELIESCKELL